MDDKGFRSRYEKVAVEKAPVKPASRAERDFWARMKAMRQAATEPGSDEP
jgi:hypothetical protein